ncbi:MAG: DUF5615 family PIN-like protein [Bryobacterales bacterium]|nr:DUF5615 family PIN-like protein [Bryobacterales bacterium]
MNLTIRWVDYLSAAGHSVLHWSAVGAGNADDSDICDYARQHRYVIITNDLDFPQIMAHTRDAQPSLILLRGQPLIPELRGESILQAIDRTQSDLETGAVVTIDWTNKIRVRVLPL